VNKYVIYSFKVKASSPIHFGSVDDGEIIKDEKKDPILFGSSIGGAIRAYLKELGLEKKAEDFLGSEIIDAKKNDDNSGSIESRVYITDGSFENAKILKKDRVKINSELGVAERNHKFFTEYLPVGMILKFKIECSLKSDKDLTELRNIIGTIIAGMKSGAILLGGQKNNGFGLFKKAEVSEEIHDFTTPVKLDKFIFGEIEQKPDRDIDWNDFKLRNNDIRRETIRMQGVFKYGVYQKYVDEKNKDIRITGVENNEIFAFSIKGLFRSEFELLLNRVMKNSKDDNMRKLADVFGGEEKVGKIRFHNMKIVEKANEEGECKKSNYDRKYIKIDRLTGGAIDGNLRTQREIQGVGELKLDYLLNDDFFIFPLIYIFKKIATAQVSLGGRTATGLGEFRASSLTIGEEEIEFRNMKENEKFRKYYESFVGWCKK